MNCLLCDKELSSDPYVLPLYEGKYAPKSDFHGPVCPFCFCRYRIPGFWKPKLGRQAEKIRILSQFLSFKQQRGWNWQYACWIFIESEQEFRILQTTARGMMRVMEAIAEFPQEERWSQRMVLEIGMRPYGKYGATSVKKDSLSDRSVKCGDFCANRLKHFFQNQGWWVGQAFRYREELDLPLFKNTKKRFEREKAEDALVADIADPMSDIYWSF